MKNHLLIPTDATLRDTVQLYWQTEKRNDFQSETIIPKGTLEIIFNFCDTADYQARQGAQEFRIPQCLIVGFNTQPIFLRLPEQQASFGVMLRPAAVQPLLGVPAGEFADQGVDLTLVDASFRSLWHRLAEQTDFNRRVDLVSDWLKRRIRGLDAREQAFNAYLNMSTDQILSVSEMAEWLCYSPRHLSRKLYQLTGMNTEQTLLYKKHVRSLFLMHHSDLTLTEIGYACGFADQSHFIKTFKSFAALTPSDYKNRKDRILGHFFENVR